MSKSKHIGIVACSAEGAALCYRTICAEAEGLLGLHEHPEVSVHTYPLAAYLRAIQKDDWKAVADLMAASAKKLARVGAELLICPDNTIHRAFPEAVQRSQAGAPAVRWLHIAEEVAREAANRRFRRVGVLGTRFLMEGPVYPEQFAPFGIEHELPALEDREKIHRIIFDELVRGKIKAASRKALIGVIERLKVRGCDAAVLGCTELPLLFETGEASPLPLLDSTRILARAALRACVAEAATTAPRRRAAAP